MENAAGAAAIGFASISVLDCIVKNEDNIFLPKEERTPKVGGIKPQPVKLSPSRKKPAEPPKKRLRLSEDSDTESTKSPVEPSTKEPIARRVKTPAKRKV
ncbi:hypothetical protein THARTR1_09814 [Trichoderma harzianum]|uniref:Uncharacterized protein n=1 Tax=Trichoderma harzianum TaxID=5544 RepID=A0A2K0TVE1_TRIHA|nr:hypothetical protein THARTR1_09814 [Trichoderma harzianum]